MRAVQPAENLEKVVEDNIGLVHLCAKRFSISRGAVRDLEYDDLFQAGCVGLIKAVENFDSSRGLKFSTYAVPVILGEIRRLFRDGGAVRISRGMRDLSKLVRDAERQFCAETGRNPTVTELAERLNITTAKAALALGVSNAPLSLSGGSDGEAIEIPIEAPEEKMTEHMALHEILATLEENDRRLIEYRYFQGKTQTVTAELLGMTQVQVSRREKKLLLYMRGVFNE